MSYTAAEEALDLKFGKTLAKYGLNGKSLFHLWIATHERDSAYMSTTKRPRITGVAGGTWRLTLPRVLYQAGIPPSLVDDMCDEETVDYLIQHYNDCLVPYAGLQEMIETLEAGGIEFWACSGASVARVKNYFDRSGIPMPLERIWDVTPVGTHKPHLEVYEYLMKERKAKDPAEVLIFGGESLVNGIQADVPSFSRMGRRRS